MFDKPTFVFIYRSNFTDKMSAESPAEIFAVRQKKIDGNFYCRQTAVYGYFVDFTAFRPLSRGVRSLI